MSTRILKVIVRKDGIEKEVRLSEITSELYEKEYKGNLFCPNPVCAARIEYVSGNVRTPYFRTKKSKIIDGAVFDEHIKDCPYYVEHESEERRRSRNDPSVYYRLSPEHKRSVLRNAYDREFRPEKFNRKTGNEDGASKKRASFRSKIDNSSLARGRAGLGIDGANEGEGREPSVFSKKIDEISDFDINNVHCVTGYVEDMQFDGPFPFFVLLRKDGQRARILFSEAFAVNNPVQYENLRIYKTYIDQYKNIGSKTFVCCIGKIIKDDFGISLIPEEYQDIDFDRKGYYQILREVNGWD